MVTESPAGSDALSRQPDRAADCQIFTPTTVEFTAAANTEACGKNGALARDISPPWMMQDLRSAAVQEMLFTSIDRVAMRARTHKLRIAISRD